VLKLFAAKSLSFLAFELVAIVFPTELNARQQNAVTPIFVSSSAVVVCFSSSKLSTVHHNVLAHRKPEAIQRSLGWKKFRYVERILARGVANEPPRSTF